MWVQVGSSHIVDFILDMPPWSPMVSLLRRYVHAVHMPQFDWSEDRGRIANQAPDERDYHSVG